ncbi:CCN family member 5 isoform X2 [Brachyhypopomus gauderio]|uniref:CCN family member 5 isoform X2 n=1 Tax=Brachyhypopomus gauderio TaxID=698409 RepID=UPI0040422292
METRAQSNHALLTWALVYLCSKVGCQQCNSPCQCPSVAASCPDATPLVLDGCGCCQVCARQKGEACTHVHLCDHQRGLQCDYGASFPGDPGECVSQEELGCELDGVSYKEGEVFQPSCAMQCRCVGGGVTCVPTCSEDVRLPSPDCPDPQRVQLPGKCCKEWRCDSTDNMVQEAQTAYSNDQSIPSLLGYQAGPSSNCIEQSTEWSACSHSCGQGLSTRVSNKNPACRQETQVRLCKVRPCHVFPHLTPKWPRRCQSSYRSEVPVRLLYWGCYSVHSYRPRYCGTCTDARCCTPYHTRTVTVTFRCQGGWLLRQPIMMIDSCICHHNCPQSPGTRPRRPNLWGLSLITH